MVERARYAIEVDHARALVRITLSGFFTHADYEGFARLRRECQAALNGRPHRTLADVRGLSIQSSEIIDAFSARLATPPFRAERLAFVVAPTLIRQQLARVTATRAARQFPSVDAAEAWLFADERAAA